MKKQTKTTETKESLQQWEQDLLKMLNSGNLTGDLFNQALEALKETQEKLKNFES